MAKSKLYNYKDSDWTTSELAGEFNVSYCRMNNLLRRFNGNIEDINHYYGQDRLSSKGKEAKTFNTGNVASGSITSGPYMTIAEIAEATGMSRAAISRRVKLQMTGVELMKKKGEKKVSTKVAEKKQVRSATAIADAIVAKANKPRETGGKRVSEFIMELEKSAKEYREKDFGTVEMIPEMEDVAELERVFGEV